MDHATVITRFSRQMLVPKFNGMEGQLRLGSTSVLIVGAGGIGSTVIMYLAGAGVQRLGIADSDCVEVSNLHRQILYSVDQVGKLKSECARDRVKAINPHIQCDIFTARVDCNNVTEIVSEFDIVVDATDNFKTRYTLSDACVFLSKPLVSGAAGEKNI